MTISQMLRSNIEEFFHQIETESGVGQSARIAEVLNLYDKGCSHRIHLTSEEVAWAGKLAWRNSERCIGRLHWNKLKTFDAQHVAGPRELFKLCLEHIDYSTNGGKIIPTMTFFPHSAAVIHFQILNDQLIRYAGYRTHNNLVLGDPSQLDLTKLAISLGWRPPKSPSKFDILPLIIRDKNKRLHYFEIPKELVLEVPILHPEFSWFEELGLKWHALPAITNKTCLVAGLNYRCAPFSGYYMGTEIGSRNFGDMDRYNMLPTVAQKMGLDQRHKSSLWKDKALVELNIAVLFSFRKAGVTILDHHTASKQFMKHIENESKCEREVPGDWSWLTPPMSASVCPVFHRYYSAERPSPKFSPT